MEKKHSIIKYSNFNYILWIYWCGWKMRGGRRKVVEVLQIIVYTLNYYILIQCGAHDSSIFFKCFQLSTNIHITFHCCWFCEEILLCLLYATCFSHLLFRFKYTLIIKLNKNSLWEFFFILKIFPFFPYLFCCWSGANLIKLIIQCQ